MEKIDFSLSVFFRISIFSKGQEKFQTILAKIVLGDMKFFEKPNTNTSLINYIKLYNT